LALSLSANSASIYYYSASINPDASDGAIFKAYYGVFYTIVVCLIPVL
jgi:hypothetical protein